MIIPQLPFPPLALLVSHGLSRYLHTHYTDRTFQHLYEWNWFDAALLIPYFAVLIVLAFYGVHRYQLVWLYFRHRKQATHEPVQLFENLPGITVQLVLLTMDWVQPQVS